MKRIGVLLVMLAGSQAALAVSGPSADARRQRLEDLSLYADWVQVVKRAAPPVEMTAWAARHGAAFRRVGPEYLLELSAHAQMYREASRGLKDLAEHIGWSVAIARSALTSLSGRAFAESVREILAGARNAGGEEIRDQLNFHRNSEQYLRFEGMDADTFSAFQEGLLEEGPGWTLEVDDAQKMLTWTDRVFGLRWETQTTFGGKRRWHLVEGGQGLHVDLAVVKTPLREFPAAVGLAVRALSKAEARELQVRGGVRIERVEKGSLADDAGLKAGDVLVEMEKREITREEDLIRALEELDVPGGLVTLKYIRGGKVMRTDLRLRAEEQK